MTASEKRTIPWVRRVRDRESQLDVDRLGWRWPDHFGRNWAGGTLADHRDDPLLVLVGERGAGKSVVFRQEHIAVEAAHGVSRLVDLPQAGYDAASVKKAIVKALAPVEGGVVRQVLLDDLDEALTSLPGVDLLLLECLNELGPEGREGLRLRISCRSALWPLRLEDGLRELWRAADVAIVALAPLGRDDVVLAAEFVNIPDAAGYIESLERRGLSPLATWPATLIPLLDARWAGAPLPTSTAEGYRQACLQLCVDAGSSAPDGRLSRDDLLQVASRVAAAMQFGGYTSIGDREAGTADPMLLLIEDLSGGHEPGLLGHDVLCETSQLRQLLQSGLVIPTGRNRWAFAHPSYQHFLAARYLERNNISSTAQAGLLWVGHASTRHVLPAHREVAAWRAAGDTDLFEDLLRDDPLVLHKADLSAVGGEDRARVVEATFTLVAQDDTVSVDIADFHRLAHNNLADQLRPYLGRTANERKRQLAALLAYICRPAELNDELLTLAEDQEAPQQSREAAVAALTDLDTAGIERVRELARDADPDVAATALRHLWPGHIELTEYLSLLSPPNPFHYGIAYARWQGALDCIDLDGALAALTWATSVLRGDGEEGSFHAAVRTVTRSMELLHDSQEPMPAIEAAAGAALIALGAHEVRLHTEQMRTTLDELRATLAKDAVVRRSVADHVLTNANERPLFTLLASLGQLFPQEDAVHWMTRWPLFSDEVRNKAGWVIRYLPPMDPEARAIGEAVRSDFEDLRAATPSWDTPTEVALVEEPLVATPNDPEVGELALQASSEARIAEATEAVLQAGTGEVVDKWLGLITAINTTPDGSVANDRTLSVVTTAPGFPKPETPLHGRLQLAAVHTLSTAPVLSPTHAVNPLPWPIASEMTAFAVLGPTGIEAIPSDDPQRWAGWALALAAARTGNDHDQALQQQFLPILADRAGAGLQPALLEALDLSDTRVLWLLTEALLPLGNAETLTTLHDWAYQPERTTQQWELVLGKLARQPGNLGDSARATLRAELATSGAPHGQDQPAAARWLIAAKTLLYTDEALASWPEIRSGLSHPPTAAAFFDLLSRIPTPAATWPEGARLLDHKDLAELFTIGHELLDESETITQPTPGVSKAPSRLSQLVFAIPDVLARQQTREAASQLDELATQYPQHSNLRRLARLTAYEADEVGASRVKFADLRKLALDAQLRVVRDERQLLDIVVESLRRMQLDLRGYNGPVVNLWNRDKASFGAETECWPCWEDDFSDAVASFLRQDIGVHRVVINREVAIRRPNLSGARTDIQIEATSPPGSNGDTIRVIIECKGCWNDELPSTVEKQLAGYLTEPHTAGLLLVAYFDCSRWQARNDSRKCRVKDHTIEEIAAYQTDKARNLSQSRGKVASAFVLDCRLPEKDWRTQDDTSS